MLTMECAGLGARSLGAVTVSFWQRGSAAARKQQVLRYGLCRPSLRVAASAESKGCVAVKEGFADEEDFVKAGGSELVFVQMQQRKDMDMQARTT